MDSTEKLIESIHKQRKKHSIILKPKYLDDEKLCQHERTQVLKEIFNRNIREKQLTKIISHLNPVLNDSHPPSVLIYGPTGSGKTVTLMHVLNSFKKVAERHDKIFNFAYVDLTSPKTYFAALNELAIATKPNTRKYRKGIPIQYMQNIIIDSLKQQQGFLALLIDEVDNLKPNPDLFLTFLGKTLPRLVYTKIIPIMLTNRLDWEKTLDPRIISFLKKTDIIFEPYNAMDLIEILKLRVQKALKKDKVKNDAIAKMAAMASRETGDARKAVELLANAAKIAEDSSGILSQTEVDLAAIKLESDKTNAMIQALAPHQKLTLIACYLGICQSQNYVATGQAYNFYTKICQKQAVTPLSQRRFSDLISFLDLYGLLNAQPISKGRYGYTRQISSTLPENIVAKLLHNI